MVEIPTDVQFYTDGWKPAGEGKKQYEYKVYCFPHAVLRALEGEHVKAKVVSEHGRLGCDDCFDFGPPQPHELGSLRRST